MSQEFSVPTYRNPKTNQPTQTDGKNYLNDGIFSPQTPSTPAAQAKHPTPHRS